MVMGKTGNIGPVVLAAGLALALGCGGRNLHSVPAISGFDPAEAAVGSTVHIVGMSFKDIDYVSFNGAPAASFHVDADSQISAVLPATACTGPVEVHNPAGIDSSTMSFVVIPAITSIDTASAAVASLPAVITLTGSGFFDASSVTIGGVAVGFTYHSPNLMTVTVPVGTPAGTTGAVILTTTPGQTCAGPVFTVTP